MQVDYLNELLPAEQLHLNAQLVHQSGCHIPGSLQYSIRQYARPQNWMADDIGVMQYHYEKDNAANNRLELRFCIAGKTYCNRDKNDCNQCKVHASAFCNEKLESVNVLQFIFSASLLEQFVKNRVSNNTLGYDLLGFRHSVSFSRSLMLCGKTRNVLEGLMNHNYSGPMENIYVNAQTQMLLLYSLDCLDDKKIDVINCKFLANEADRVKINKAREILVEKIGDPITIKELSRKVAMNECYLKKGFKEMFGATIFEFYQGQRMEHAKYLLYEKGLTVTEVSVLLGYSSISHFSTAFKKHTGLKPCELLLRGNV
ncbi:MAG: AraC family transcriptional regulator [Bacteroidota bacterium]